MTTENKVCSHECVVPLGNNEFISCQGFRNELMRKCYEKQENLKKTKELLAEAISLFKAGIERRNDDDYYFYDEIRDFLKRCEEK